MRAIRQYCVLEQFMEGEEEMEQNPTKYDYGISYYFNDSCNLMILIDNIFIKHTCTL